MREAGRKPIPIPSVAPSIPPQVLGVKKFKSRHNKSPKAMVRFNRNQQKFIMANMDQSWTSKFMNSNKERENLARICWLLIDAGTKALKTVFDSVHPPLSLRDHLSQAHVKAVLSRMLENEVLTEKQWKLLYPTKKKHVTSQKYDSRTLVTLLQSICHLCPPYPNGWGSHPLSTDSSLSADVVRMQLVHQQIGHTELMSMDEFSRTFRQVKEVLLRLGGPPMRMKQLHRMEQDQLTQEMQNHYIATIREHWGDGRKLITSPMSSGSLKKRSKRNKDQEQNGLAAEDKAVMRKVHKLLVDNVQAEDLLDRLQQNQIIKFSDRQEILAISKSSDRMNNLLDRILNSKLTFAFKALCESMKFKYKKIYDTVIQIRKETWKMGVQNIVDVVGILSETLGNYYRIHYAKCTPFPWSETTVAGIRDLYTPLDILDGEGKKIHMNDFFPVPSTGSKGRRILLEGISGSGKSVLCQFVTYLWATQKGYFKQHYPILLHADLQVIKGNFFEQVFDQVMPADVNFNVSDFRGMLEDNSQHVVLFLDGFEGRSDAADLKAILSGDILRHATIIVAANPEILPPNDFTPDSKLFCMGFNQNNVARCMKNYLQIFRADIEHHQRLFDMLADDSWVLKPHLTRPVFCLLAFAYYQTTKQANLKDITTMTSLHESYGIAMAMNYCRKAKIDVIGFEFPDDVVDAANQLGVLSFKTLLDDRKAFTAEELEEEVKNTLVYKLCALTRFTPGGPYKFLCDLMHSFLAAKHLADLSLEEINKTLKDRNITKHPKFTQLVCFLCGLYRNDFDTPTVRSIFTELSVRNVRNTKVTSEELETPHSEKHLRSPSGQIMDFSTSLQSLIECKCREDACEIVSLSLPSKIIVKRNGLIPFKTLRAFSNIVQFETNRITHLEFHLHSMFTYQESAFLEVAKAMGRCPKLKSVRIYWSSLELMSVFMNVLMAETESLENVILDDACKKSLKTVTAATWATLQDACQNMYKCNRFSFINGKVAAITYFVLQHLPNSIKQLNFAGCSMNMMCASELASKLEKSTALEKLDITDAHLAGSEFVAILQGLKLCGTIKHLKLCGAKLDRPGVETLADCLKLTTSLQVLDLSYCQLSTEMCEWLAEAIVQNRSLQRLVLKNTKVTSQGLLVISHSKVDQLKVIGLDKNQETMQSV